MLNRFLEVPELNSRNAMGYPGGSKQGLTNECTAYTIPSRRGGVISAHYELIWEILVKTSEIYLLTGTPADTLILERGGSGYFPVKVIRAV